MAMLWPYSRSARAINIVLRTAHLFAMTLFVGAVFATTADPSLPTWRRLTVGSGIALFVSEMSHSRHWLYQVRGVVTIAHVGVLALLGAAGTNRYVCTAALLIGAVGSHIPRVLRLWSFRHRAVVD